MKKPLTPIPLDKVLDEIEAIGMHKWLVKEMTRAFMEARKGKRSTHDMHEFELHWEENILNLVKSIEERTYEPGSSISFVVFDPMVREIFAAPSRDRSVHHFAYDLHAGWFDVSFIATSTSCRPGKGTLYGVKCLQRHMREVTENGTKKAMGVRLDLQGYFMSINREKLKQRIFAGIEEQFKPYRGRRSAEQLLATSKFLWEKIIMDDPVKKARRRGNPGNWNPNILPSRKSLYCQPAGQGIVIGNLTSQLSSNILLGFLDYYVTEVLGYKYYGRYVDDFYILVLEEDYPKLKRDIRLIEKFLKDELGLSLHPNKRYAQSVYKGMTFLGVRVYLNCLYPSDRLQRKFRKAVHDYNKGHGKIDTVISYLGHMKQLDADNFVRKVFKEVNWNYDAYLEFKKPIRRPAADLVREMRGR